MSPVITTFGREVDERSYRQLERCLELGDYGVLCADHHLGYSQPIGGAIAYPDHISPSGVGFDVGCGNKAVRTDLAYDEIRDDLPALMDTIVERISFGMGRTNKEPVADHPVLDKIREAPYADQRDLLDLAAGQLGTVGGGNHYVDLFADETGDVWIGVHFGSRGFGHRTATGFLALAQGLKFTDRPKEGGMDAPPVLLDANTDLGQAYISSMELAGEYAYAGRDWVCDKVLEILTAESTFEVHNHHNYAWRETHFGRDYWVVRKGCTPAFPGQLGFVGASMAGDSVILEGVESPRSEQALYSTVHGAGRAMSRTQAAGKARSVWECTDRSCSFYVLGRDYQAARAGRPQDERFTLCRDHPDGRMVKHRRVLQQGLVDWGAVTKTIEAKGIELRGGAADEAPEAYKSLPDVLDAHAGTIDIVHRLRPVGVAMAGADVFDPFKD